MRGAWMSSVGRPAVHVGLAGVLALAVATDSTPSGQADRSQPSFPAQAEAITVDVVVLDKDGQPVAGLTRDDFTLLEEGRPQPIVGFEARDARVPEAAARAAADAAVPERVVANVVEGSRRGRVLILVIDDLGLPPPMAQQLGPALARWIREKAEPTDEITIQTTSGDLWWSAEVGTGRADLVAVLDRLRGKRALPSSTEWISDVEAYQIVVHEGHGQAGELESSKGDKASITIAAEEPSPPPPMELSASVLDRVATRFLEARSCVLVRAPRPAMFRCKEMAMTRAEEVYAGWSRRAGAVLDLVARVSADVAGLPGRKSILLVSDDFLRDVNLERRFRDVVDTAQRSNTALYFSRASGLTGPAFYTASGGGNPHPSDVATLGAEQMRLAVGGGDHLADATGGASITTSNDLSAGLARMASDGAAYYLLGYQPSRPPDGRWHRLEVKVLRKGVEVRARRGYVAGPSLSTRAPRKPPAADGGAEAAKRALPSLSAGARGEIPLRVASYLKGPDGAGAARVLMVVEIDGERVRTTETAGGEKARLELGILAVFRDQPRVLPLAQILELTLRPRDKGWWAFFREVRLPPGVAQLRVRVRDSASGAQGVVAQRIEIPDVESTYLSTPLVSDATQPPRETGEPPQLVPTARRSFPARGTLYCQYEVFSFGGRDMPGVARVIGGYTLSRSNGEVVTTAPPTLIATDGSRVVRRLALPLEGMAPGAYDLVLTVEDHLANRTFTARERFEVVPQVAQQLP
jgi:VWFA-related protein